MLWHMTVKARNVKVLLSGSGTEFLGKTELFKDAQVRALDGANIAYTQ